MVVGIGSRAIFVVVFWAGSGEAQTRYFPQGDGLTSTFVGQLREIARTGLLGSVS